MDPYISGGAAHEEPRVFRVDDSLLQRKLRNQGLVLLSVWAGMLILFLISSFQHPQIPAPPDPTFFGILGLLLLAGPVLLYSYRRGAARELADSLGAELQLRGETCELRRPMRRSGALVQFRTGDVSVAHELEKDLTILFRSYEPWMRRRALFLGFSPAVVLLGVPNGKEAARALSVRCGASARQGALKRATQRRRRIAWLTTAAGWILLILAILFTRMTADVFAHAAIVLLMMTLLFSGISLANALYRCRVRRAWKARRC